MTATEVSRAPGKAPATCPGRPSMLSHVAYVTHDTQATVEFYRDILGMELVNAVLDDKIPSTGDPVPYFHSFFRMDDGSTVAFFEAPELPLPAEHPHPAYDIFNHLAMEVGSQEDVDLWHLWLVDKGVEVLGPVHHGIIYSIYFHDPNGLRLEITAPLDVTWNDRAESAAESLTEWNAAKALAKESGRDMVSILADLTREKSHRRANHLDEEG